MQEDLGKIKLVVALRMARAAVGWSQEELATQLGIPKTTIARMETQDGGLSAEQLARVLKLYRTQGVELDFMYEDEVKCTVSPQALAVAQGRLDDDTLRRNDRKRALHILVRPPG